MPNQNHLKESSKLIEIIKKLDFVTEAQTESITNIKSSNFNNTLIYNKGVKGYIANINFCGSNYKISIKVLGNKSNPRYEKKIKKVFPR